MLSACGAALGTDTCARSIVCGWPRGHLHLHGRLPSACRRGSAAVGSSLPRQRRKTSSAPTSSSLIKFLAAFTTHLGSAPHALHSADTIHGSKHQRVYLPWCRRAKASEVAAASLWPSLRRSRLNLLCCVYSRVQSRRSRGKPCTEMPGRSSGSYTRRRARSKDLPTKNRCRFCCQQ